MKKETFAIQRDTPLFYSDAVTYGGLAYICGQMSLDLETDRPIHGDIREETTRMLANLETVLSSVGCSKDDVLSVTVYMKEDEDFDVYNQVYGDFFGGNFPVRTTVTVKQLYDDLRVEMSAIAAVPQ